MGGITIIKIFVNNATAADELVLCERILKLVDGECRVFSSRANRQFRLNVKKGVKGK
jgi:hypothetical protein